MDYSASDTDLEIGRKFPFLTDPQLGKQISGTRELVNNGLIEFLSAVFDGNKRVIGAFVLL